MRVVLQRVSRAAVEVDDRRIAAVGRGVVALVGIAAGDGPPEVDYCARKLAALRLFGDAQGRLDLDLKQAGGTVLVVSQFTLLAKTRKGRRPSFAGAATPEKAQVLVELFAERLRAYGVPVEVGRFGASMRLEIVNEGPVTIVIDRVPRDEAAGERTEA